MSTPSANPPAPCAQSPDAFRKVFKRLALVVVLFAGANFAFGLVLDRARLHDANRESGLVNEGRAAGADILILGSSRAKHHYDEKLLAKLWGISVYNAGFSGQGVPFQRVAFGLIASVKKPRAVIVDVMAFDDDLDRVHAMDPWYGDSPVLRAMPPSDAKPGVVSVPEDFKTGLLMRLPTYRFAGKIWQTLSDKSHLGETPYFEALPTEYKADRWGAAGGAVVAPKAYPFFKAQLGALVHEIRATGAEVVLVYSPNFANRSNPFITGPSAEVAREKSVPFIAYDDTLLPALKDRKLFFDGLHLNGEGAEIFSRDVAQRLRPLLPLAFGEKTGATGK